MAKPRTAEDLAKQVERARAVRTLQEHAGWQVVDQILAEGIENARSRILSDDCDFDEVRVLRVLVRWMRRMRETPQITDQDIQKWEGELAFRQKLEKMRLDLGMRPGHDKAKEAP